MKKFWLFILITISFFIFSKPTYASDQYIKNGEVYRIDEACMNITMPVYFFVYTDKDSLGDKFEDTKEFISDNDLSIYAVDTRGVIISVRELDVEDGDFVGMSDGDIALVGEALAEGYSGFSVYGNEVYYSPQIPFYRFFFESDDASLEKPIYGECYLTICNEKAVVVDLFSNYSKVQSTNYERILNSIIDSITFDSLVGKQSKNTDNRLATSSSSEFVYTDKLTGISFIVPEKWVQLDFNDEDETIQAIFSNVNDADAIIYFGSEDFSQVSQKYGKKGTKRGDYYNFIFSEEDIEEMYSLEKNTVHKKSYGKEFFEWTGINNERNAEVIHLLRVENGNIYTFQFYGGKKSSYYEDFVKLVSSSTYPIYNEDESANRYSDGNTLSFIWCILLSLLIAVVPISIFRFVIKREPVEKKDALIGLTVFVFCAMVVCYSALDSLNENKWYALCLLIWYFPNYIMLTFVKKEKKPIQGENVSLEEQPNALDDEAYIQPEEEYAGYTDRAEYFYCRNCGKKLHSGSNFCSGCGVKIDY